MMWLGLYVLGLFFSPFVYGFGDKMDDKPYFKPSELTYATLLWPAVLVVFTFSQIYLLGRQIATRVKND